MWIRLERNFCLIMGELLKKKGVERIEALGQPFDPHKHEAVMVEEDSEVGFMMYCDKYLRKKQNK